MRSNKGRKEPAMFGTSDIETGFVQNLKIFESIKKCLKVLKLFLL